MEKSKINSCFGTGSKHLSVLFCVLILFLQIVTDHPIGTIFSQATGSDVVSLTPVGSASSSLDDGGKVDSLASGGASIVGGDPAETLMGTPPVWVGPSGIQVNMWDGSLTLSRTDLEITGRFPLPISFSYISRLCSFATRYGCGWRFPHDIYYVEDVDGITVVWGNGGSVKFVERLFVGSTTSEPLMVAREARGEYAAPPGVSDTLEEYSQGKFVVTTKDGYRFYFDDDFHKHVTRVADRNDNTWYFVYDWRGFLTMIEERFWHEFGRQIGLYYDDLGRLVWVTFENRQIGLDYDTEGNLVRMRIQRQDTLQVISETRYTYSPEHLLTRITAPLNREANITYSNGMVTNVKTALTDTHFSYDYLNNVTAVTESVDGTEQTTKYFYDDFGRCYKVTDPLGNSVFSSWDGDDVIGITDQNGHTTKYIYDSERNPLMIVNPAGGVITYTYGKYNEITSVTNAMGYTWRNEYDDRGNWIKKTDPFGNNVTYTYNDRGDLIKIQYPTGYVTYSYNDYGIVSSETDSLGHFINYTYDDAGNLISIVDPYGNSEIYTYDVLGRCTSSTDRLGRRFAFSYDEYDNLISVVDPLDRTALFEYDVLGRQIRAVNPLGNEIRFSYDSQGNLETYTNPLGRNVTFTYDLLNELMSETDPLGYKATYAYDAVGNLISVTDANNATTRYVYNALDRLITIDYPDNNDVHYSYDAVGNVISMSNAYATLKYYYDALNRVTRIEDVAHSKSIECFYDGNGNLIRWIDPDGGATTYDYDAAGRVVSITNPKGENITFSHDKMGRLTKKVYPNGIIALFSYDAEGHLTSLVYRNSSDAVIMSFSYDYDAVGNKLKVVEADGTTTRYGYDALDRLINVTYSDISIVTYSYDAVGNRISSTSSSGTVNYVYDAANRLLKAGNTTYEWDNNGNLVKKTDGQGTTTYAYDFANRLTSITYPDHTGTNYTYYPDGRLLSKTTGENSTYYFYDGVNVLFEMDQNWNPTTRYTCTGIDNRISMERGGSSYYYLYDNVGNVVGLTDSNQEVIATYEYDAFGVLRSRTGDVANSYLYIGREYDEKSQLYNFRARHYDPDIGRFTTKDPISNYFNQYVYVSNNPVKLVDPTGLVEGGMWKDEFPRMVGGTGYPDYVSVPWQEKIQCWQEYADKAVKDPNEVRYRFPKYALGKWFAGLLSLVTSTGRFIKWMASPIGQLAKFYGGLAFSTTAAPLAYGLGMCGVQTGFLGWYPAAAEPFYLTVQSTYIAGGPGGFHLGISSLYGLRHWVFHVGLPEHVAQTQFGRTFMTFFGRGEFFRPPMGGPGTYHYYPLKGLARLGAVIVLYPVAVYVGVKGCDSKADDSPPPPGDEIPPPELEPGGDYPDDTFDVSSGYISIEDNFDVLMRQASKKNLTNLLKLKEYMDNQERFNEFTDLRLQKDEVLEWSLTQAQLYTRLLENQDQLAEELRTASDVALLSRGFYREAASVLTAQRVAFRLIEPQSISSDLAKYQKALLIPSGGLYGIDTPLFRSNLAKYVANGGILIVFSQQHGYDYAALPGEGVSGFGWLEDQSCQYASSAISTFHPMLSGQNSTTPSINVDGFFTKWPANATILLTRTKNAMPALLLYGYGQGQVVVSSVYDDQAYGRYAAAQDGLVLIRDMVAWATSPPGLTILPLDQPATVDVHIMNNASVSAVSARIVAWRPDLSVGYNQTLTVSLAPSSDVTLSPSLTPNISGMWRFDYLLYNENGSLIQTTYDAVAFYASSLAINPGGYAKPGARVYLTVTSDYEHYPCGSPAVFTFILVNTGSAEKNVTVTWGAVHHGWAQVIPGGWDDALSRSVIVPANGQTSFNYTLPEVVDSDRLRARLLENNQLIGYSEKGFYVIMSHDIPVSVRVHVPSGVDYYPYANASVTATVTNYGRSTLSASLTIKMLGPRGQLMYQGREALLLAPYQKEDSDFTIPIPAIEPGDYQIAAFLDSGGRRVGYDTAFIKIQGYSMTISPDRSNRIYAEGETARLEISLSNKMDSPLSGKLNATEPTLNFSWTDTISLASKETGNLTLEIPIPEGVSIGRHDISVTFSYDNSTRSAWLIVPPTDVSLQIAESTYQAGGSLQVYANNTGGVESRGNLTLTIAESVRTRLVPLVLTQVGLEVPAKVGQFFQFTLPDQVLDGFYVFTVAWQDQYGVSASTSKTVHITGLSANLTVNTESEFYDVGQRPNATANIINQDGAIVNATLAYMLYLSEFAGTRLLAPVEVNEDINYSSSDNVYIQSRQAQIGITVRNKNGRFLMRTGLTSLSDPWAPGSSWTTIRLYPMNVSLPPVNLIFGDSKVGILTVSNQHSAEENNSIIATWKPNDYNVTVTQTIWIIQSDTGKPDTAVISYTVKNSDPNIANVAIRIMIDTLIGPLGYMNDGCPFIIPGVGNVTKERDFVGDAVPSFWQTVDSLASPTTVAQGTLKGVGLDPYRFVIADWKHINSTLWDYVIDPYYPVVSDSAVAIYYDLGVAPGDETSIVTAYGLGKPRLSFSWNYSIRSDVDASGRLSHNVTLPAISIAGRYTLRATLVSSMNQTIADKHRIFYVFDRNVTLTCDMDKQFYKFGETATMSGTVLNFNSAPVDATLKVYLNDSLSVERTIRVEASGQTNFSWSFTVNGSYNMVAEVDGFSTMIDVQMVRPDVDVTIEAPSVVGSAPFTAFIRLSNPKPVPASIIATFNEEKLGSFAIEPYSSTTLSGEVAVKEDTELCLTLSGDVIKEVRKAVMFGEDASLVVHPTPTYPAGIATIPFNVTNTGLLSSTFKVVLEIEGQTAEYNFTIPVDATISGEASFNLTKGMHNLSYRVLNAYNVLLNQGTSALCVEVAELEICGLPGNATVAIGQFLNVSFTVRNPSAIDTEALVTVLVPGIFNETHSFWVERGDHQLAVPIDIPDDLDSRTVRSTYSINNVTGQFWLTIQGYNVIVNATLNKPFYSEGDIAMLNLTVRNAAPFNGSFYSRVKLASYDEIRYYNLSVGEETALTFHVPAVFTGEKMLYTVYVSSGRALHINSVYIYEKPDEVHGIALHTDRQVYSIGETVTIYVNAAKNGILTVSAPKFNTSVTIELAATFELSFIVPELRTGTYHIEYTFGDFTGEYPIDVVGYHAKVPECTLDKQTCKAGDNLTLKMTVEAGRSFNGTLRIRIYDPLENRLIRFDVNKSLTVGENEITVTKNLQTNRSGTYSIIYGVYADIPGHSLVKLASGSEYFDVVDTFPPTTTVSLTGVPGDNNWFTSDVTVALDATDDADVDKTEYSFDNVAWNIYIVTLNITDEGYKTIYYKSTDKAGNVETIRSEELKIDKTSPAISIASPRRYEGSSTVTANWTGSDDVSGISHYEIQLDGDSWINTGTNTTKTFENVAEGAHNVTIRGVDKAGKVKLASYLFTVDITLPSVQILLPITEAVIRSSSVTAAWSGSDAISGVAYFEVRIDNEPWIDKGTETTHIFNGSADGSHTIYVRAFDKAGNSKEDSVNFTINTSLIGGPGWMDDMALFAGIGAAALVVSILILRRKKILPK